MTLYMDDLLFDINNNHGIRAYGHSKQKHSKIEQNEIK